MDEIVTKRKCEQSAVVSSERPKREGLDNGKGESREIASSSDSGEIGLRQRRRIKLEQ